MTIETKYGIGQTIYFFREGDWWSGKIAAIRITPTVWYEIGEIVGDLLGWTKLSEGEIVIEMPEGFEKLNQFVDLFPEFNAEEKHQLIHKVRQLRQEAAKRNPVAI